MLVVVEVGFASAEFVVVAVVMWHDVAMWHAVMPVMLVVVVVAVVVAEKEKH